VPTIEAPPITVRELRPDDWPAVRQIYLDGIRSGLASFETEAPSWEAWDAKNVYRVVAESFDGVLGWAAASRVSPRWCYRGVIESSVYVAPEARGRGVGRTLMHELIERSERDGVWTIEAGIFPENEASLKLHQALGFRVVGVRSAIGKRDGLWRDVVLLERRSEVIR
jgi:L-amino acid N-acyltransferase YncA